MSEKNNPLQTLAAWIDEQHVDIRNDICWLVGYSASRIMAGYPEGYAEDRPQAFLDWLTRQDQLAYHAVAAKAIAVRAQIAYLVGQRGTEESWKESRANMQWAIERAKEEGNQEMVDFGVQQLSKAPEREARWLDTAAKWHDLLDGAISDSAIKAWVTEQMYLTNLSLKQGY
ncbi:hypothetical protein DFLDMN_001074 [Cupriavidus sp. H19C3]|uniref:hypothetical protein n=1 Tax=Cupriavidus sp. H19C3 TaxID=3241603 RepID=UPI003BF907F6